MEATKELTINEQIQNDVLFIDAMKNDIEQLSNTLEKRKKHLNGCLILTVIATFTYWPAALVALVAVICLHFNLKSIAKEMMFTNLFLEMTVAEKDELLKQKYNR